MQFSLIIKPTNEGGSGRELGSVVDFNLGRDRAIDPIMRFYPESFWRAEKENHLFLFDAVGRLEFVGWKQFEPIIWLWRRWRTETV